MSYAKMMKWNKKHPKGISYKKGYMGFDTSTPGRFTPSLAYLEDYFEYRADCEKVNIVPASCEDYYYKKWEHNEILKQAQSNKPA